MTFFLAGQANFEELSLLLLGLTEKKKTLLPLEAASYHKVDSVENIKSDWSTIF